MIWSDRIAVPESCQSVERDHPLLCEAESTPLSGLVEYLWSDGRCFRIGEVAKLVLELFRRHPPDVGFRDEL